MLSHEGISILFAQVVTGISVGLVYGILGLAVVLLYRSNHIVNFAMGQMVTLLVIVMFFLLKRVSYPVAALLTLLIAFVGGILFHVGAFRVLLEWRAFKNSSVVNRAVDSITIGLFFVFESVSFYVFGDEANPFPTPLEDNPVKIWNADLSVHTLVIFGFSALLVAFTFAFYRYTKIGLVLEAVAENIMVARWRGIRASNYLAFAWGLTLAMGATAGILLAPILFLTPDMLIGTFSYSMIAVIIGGLESPLGTLVGGVIVGLTENLSSNISFIGSDLKYVAVLAVLILVLIIRPRGLWGRTEARRV